MTPTPWRTPHLPPRPPSALVTSARARVCQRRPCLPSPELRPLTPFPSYPQPPSPPRGRLLPAREPPGILASSSASSRPAHSGGHQRTCALTVPGDVQGRLLPHGRNGSHQGPGRQAEAPQRSDAPGRPSSHSPRARPLPTPSAGPRRTLSGGTLWLTCRPAGSAGGNRRERGWQPARLSSVQSRPSAGHLGKCRLLGLRGPPPGGARVGMTVGRSSRRCRRTAPGMGAVATGAGWRGGQVRPGAARGRG